MWRFLCLSKHRPADNYPSLILLGYSLSLRVKLPGPPKLILPGYLSRWQVPFLIKPANIPEGSEINVSYGYQCLNPPRLVGYFTMGQGGVVPRNYSSSAVRLCSGQGGGVWLWVGHRCTTMEGCASLCLALCKTGQVRGRDKCDWHMSQYKITAEAVLSRKYYA